MTPHRIDPTLSAFGGGHTHPPKRTPTSHRPSAERYPRPRAALACIALAWRPWVHSWLHARRGCASDGSAAIRVFRVASRAADETWIATIMLSRALAARNPQAGSPSRPRPSPIRSRPHRPHPSRPSPRCARRMISPEPSRATPLAASTLAASASAVSALAAVAVATSAVATSAVPASALLQSSYMAWASYRVGLGMTWASLAEPPLLQLPPSSRLRPSCLRPSCARAASARFTSARTAHA